MAERENNMKTKNRMTYGVLIAALMLLCLAALACHTPIMPGYSANKDVLYFRDFALSTESVNLTTSARGAIFVKEDRDNKDARQIQISARVEIDPRDWGGVAFYAPAGWKFSHIASDYPQGSSTPERYITVFNS
jgi:hypothetical protein